MTRAMAVEPNRPQRIASLTPLDEVLARLDALSSPFDRLRASFPPRSGLRWRRT